MVLMTLGMNKLKLQSYFGIVLKLTYKNPITFCMTPTNINTINCLDIFDKYHHTPCEKLGY